MRVSVHDAEGQLAELVRRAEAGDEIVLTREGQADVRLVPIEPIASPETETSPEERARRRALLERISREGAANAKPGPSAARSQDFLYDDDGLPW